MDYEFNSKEELYERVLPALKLKVKEFKKINKIEIDCLDIWNYLIETSWKSGNNLMLSDIVNDILQLENNKLITYLDNSNKH